jgi:hypothetical protein
LEFSVTNLQHSFIQIGGELYAIGNKEEGAFLGQGLSGELFRARNYKGEEVAVGEQIYLVMALLNSQEFMSTHE